LVRLFGPYADGARQFGDPVVDPVDFVLALLCFSQRPLQFCHLLAADGHVVEHHVVGDGERRVEVIELVVGVHFSVDDQAAVPGARDDIGVEGLQHAFVAPDGDRLGTVEQTRHVGVEVGLVEVEGVHHRVSYLPQDAPAGDRQCGVLVGVLGEHGGRQLFAQRQFPQRLQLQDDRLVLLSRRLPAMHHCVEHLGGAVVVGGGVDVHGGGQHADDAVLAERGDASPC